MKALSLFSGIGGIDLACEWAGIETVAFCEREPFCQKVLNKHWPGIPIYDDVCTLTKERLDADGIGTIDIIHGGYPCQPFSVAGQREGQEDDRHLWPEYFRLVQEIGPRWIIGENVVGHITLGLDGVLSDLEGAGYTTRAITIPAAAIGAQHRRERVFIVGYSKYNGLSTPKIGRISDQTSDNHKKRQNKAGKFQGTSGREYNAIVANTDCSRELQQERKLEKLWRRISNSGQIIPDTNSKGLQRSEEAGNLGNSWAEQYQQSPRCYPSAAAWSIEPRVGRVANGVPDRIHRIKALGNAVVPGQIYPILAGIKQIDDMLNEVKP